MAADASRIFREAVFRGHGKAYRLLKVPTPADQIEAIIRACIVDTRFDRQCEWGRAAFLAELVLRAECLERALEAIRSRSRRTRTTDRNRDHQFDMLGEFASRGDRRAREWLEDAAICGWAEAEGALVALDGLPAVLRLLDRPDYELTDRKVPDWFWRFDQCNYESTERALLESGTPNALALIERLRAMRPAKSSSKPEGKPTFDELRDRLVGSSTWEEIRRQCIRFRRRATEDDFRPAAEELVLETDPDRIQGYAWLLGFSSFEGKAEIVLQRSADTDDIARSMVRALRKTTGSEVRAFGLDLLGRKPSILEGLELLGALPMPGDERLAWRCLRYAQRRNLAQLHSVITDVLGLVHGAEHLEWNRCLLWIYDSSPCALCRERAFRQMSKRGEATTEMIGEHAWDSECLGFPPD